MEDEGTSTTRAATEPFLEINGTRVYRREDWNVGIGGGLWTTGAAWARYFQLRHASVDRRLAVLELGSGNGILAVCFAAIDPALFRTVVVTDLRDHLQFIRDTVRYNQRHNPTLRQTRFSVLEHVWGSSETVRDNNSNSSSNNGNNDNDSNETLHGQSFDVVLASDVVYRNELHDPFLLSLQHFTHPSSLIFLGVTMHDTPPVFFRKLRQSGFVYERIADHHLPPQFRGFSFGLFVVQHMSDR